MTSFDLKKHMRDTMSNKPGKVTSLPQLIELPVLRAKYADQKTVDGALQYLWDNETEDVIAMANEEQWPYPDNRGTGFRKYCYNLGVSLRENAAELNIPDNKMALLDILFELSRRLRKTFDLPDISGFGNSLGVEPEGPFPPLPNETGQDEHDVNKICQQLYQENPALMYALCEQSRLLIHTHEIEDDFSSLFDDITNDPLKKAPLKSGLKSRLDTLCSRPEVITIQEALSP